MAGKVRTRVGIADIGDGNRWGGMEGVLLGVVLPYRRQGRAEQRRAWSPKKPIGVTGNSRARARVCICVCVLWCLWRDIQRQTDKERKR